MYNLLIKIKDSIIIFFEDYKERKYLRKKFNWKK
jgi:hypothetical protein